MSKCDFYKVDNGDSDLDSSIGGNGRRNATGESIRNRKVG